MTQILISSSLLIAVILLARWLLRKRVSKRLIYGAWLLVALRLLIPIQFGHSQYSVAAMTEQLEQRSEPIQQVQQSLQDPIAGPSRAEVYEQLLRDYIQGEPAPSAPASSAPQTPQMTRPVTPAIQEKLQQEAQEQISAPTLEQVLTAIWMGGMVIIAAWFLITNLLFLHRARKNAEPFACDTSVRVRISPNIPSPCLVGLFRPVIYLTPGSIQDDQTLRHILTHETAHLRHGDHIWSWVRCICLCVYWFNPLVWIAATLSKRDCELACDESALKKLGSSERIAYGQTLLTTVSQARSPAHILETATAMNETKKQLKERVSFIVKKPRNLFTCTVCLILVASLAAGCAFLGSKPEPKSDSTATEPTPSAPPSTPTSPAEPTTPPIEGPTTPPDISNSLETAELMIEEYKRYKVLGACCDYEPVAQDMSQFLTEEQASRYDSLQYRLTCCHNVQEVHAHIDRRIAPSLQKHGYPDELLFSDDQGELYLIVTPTGYDDYRHITVDTYTNTQLTATACIYDEDGCWSRDTFTMDRIGDGLIISHIVHHDTPPASPSPHPLISSVDPRLATMELAKKKLGLSYVEFLYAGNAIVQSVIEESVPQDNQALAQIQQDTFEMYQRILYIDHDNTLMMHFPVSFSKETSYSIKCTRPFTFQTSDTFQRDAYHWFFEELGPVVDGYYADTYASTLTDSLFQSPELFVAQLSQCSDGAISNVAMLIAYDLSPDERAVYSQLLASLLASIDQNNPNGPLQRTIHSLFAAIQDFLPTSPV